MVGFIDQRLDYIWRNQGGALYPMFDDYTRQGGIPDDALYPDWFQAPPQRYVDPTSRDIYTDYSAFHGYGQDIPFGGPPGGTYNPNYFGGSSSGGSGGSGGGFGFRDNEADD